MTLWSLPARQAGGSTGVAVVDASLLSLLGAQGGVCETGAGHTAIAGWVVCALPTPAPARWAPTEEQRQQQHPSARPCAPRNCPWALCMETLLSHCPAQDLRELGWTQAWPAVPVPAHQLGAAYTSEAA